MDRRTLGKTGLLLHPIGFGAFKIGRNRKTKYPVAYPLPSDREVGSLLNGALDAGINLIDTAPAYGSSEERIGKAISHRRQEYYLSTKVGESFDVNTSRYDFSAAAIRTSVENSLRRLRTDILDIVFIHSHGDDLDIVQQTDCVETLFHLRSRGFIRYVGLSGKTLPGERAALEWADALMVEFHPNDTSHREIIDAAAATGTGILVKKPLASGTIEPGQAIPFILRHENIAAVVIGSLSLKNLRDDIHIAQRALSAAGSASSLVESSTL